MSRRIRSSWMLAPIANTRAARWAQRLGILPSVIRIGGVRKQKPQSAGSRIWNTRAVPRRVR